MNNIKKKKAGKKPGEQGRWSDLRKGSQGRPHWGNMWAKTLRGSRRGNLLGEEHSTYRNTKYNSLRCRAACRVSEQESLDRMIRAKVSTAKVTQFQPFPPTLGHNGGSCLPAKGAMACFLESSPFSLSPGLAPILTPSWAEVEREDQRLLLDKNHNLISQSLGRGDSKGMLFHNGSI